MIFSVNSIVPTDRFSSVIIGDLFKGLDDKKWNTQKAQFPHRKQPDIILIIAK